MIEYHRQATLKDALEVRAATGARPLAGGTDLLVRHRNWAGTLPRLDGVVLYIGHLSELRSIEGQENGSTGGLRIGAGVTYAELLDNPATPELLRRSIEELAAPGLRNVATLAGNICNASPAADATCALYALDAEVELARPDGRRRLPIETFVTGPGQTLLAADELLVAVHLPPAATAAAIQYYHKVGTRKANALSKLSICARAAMTDGRIADVAIALGAVAPTIVRSREIEGRVLGMTPKEAAARAAEIAGGYQGLIRPIDDQRSTAAYRRHTAVALVERFLSERLP